MLRWVVLSLALLAPPSGSLLVYDLDWEVHATVSRIDRQFHVETKSGSMSGTARLVLRPEGDRILSFEWHGPEGDGSGLIGPDGPEHVSFPLPPEVGFPPAPPFRGTGEYRYDGDRDRPSRFTIGWLEAFYCRTDPDACDRVTHWERSFAGSARRLHRDARAN